VAVCLDWTVDQVVEVEGCGGYWGGLMTTVAQGVHQPGGSESAK
jgi:hypothetical protein